MCNTNVLLLNIAVDKSNVSLGFTQSWINEFSKHYDFVDVVTLNKIDDVKLENVNVYGLTSSDSPKKIDKIIKLRKIVRELTSQKKYNLVFSHMSPILLIIAKLFNKSKSSLHVLWYTHPMPDSFIKKIILYISLYFSDKVVTASNTSFPINSQKVSQIGHAIDYEKFYLKRAKISISKFLILSRISTSKNIDFIIEEFLSSQFNHLTLDIIGDCLTSKDSEYKKFLENKYAKNKNINFIGKIDYQNLSSILKNYDVHISATAEGFYDKSVLETMANGIINFYCNSDYSKHFSKEYQEILQFKMVKNSLANQLNKIKNIENSFLLTMVDEVQKNANKESLESIIYRINNSIQIQSS